MPSSSTMQSPAFVPLHEKCQYPSKCCPERRAVKECGELHRLCEFHRRLANRNQQRLQQRRRMLRESAALGAAISNQMTTSRPKMDPIDMNDVLPHGFDGKAPVSPVDGLGELCLEDLDILLQLLDNENEGLTCM